MGARGLFAARTAALAILGASAVAGAAQANESRVETALTNIMTLHRPGQDGLATIWDKNKYVQCRLRHDRTLRCEAGGAPMQPSLARILSPERIARLTALGWTLDASFGNYVRIFPSELPVKEIAARVVQALQEGYDADITELEAASDWIKSDPCPPRHGPSQSLAGKITTASAMAGVSVHGCSYKPKDEPPAQVSTKADLITIYATRVTGEIQRLRVNIDRQQFTWIVIDTGFGYVQCGTAPPRTIYCEAQSAETSPAIARVLTAERVAKLYAAGYADPGRAPNYWKEYSLEQFSDRSIAEELLSILYEAYAYNGVPRLDFKTEEN
ncbi:MAG: hypothetical protein WDO17_18220 [Alphaproteobacteria bacterium]